MALRPRRKLRPEKLAPVLRFIPSDLENQTAPCDKCERPYPIPWTLEYEFEQHPFISADGKTWACTGVAIDCPLCGEQTTLEFPRAKASGRIELFSDEAERDLKGGWRLCAFSFFGMGTDHLDPFRRALGRLKRKLAPDLDPDTWASHATDLVSSERRRKLLDGTTVSKDAIFEFLAGFASLIKTHGHPDFAHVVGGIGRPRRDQLHNRFVQEHKEMVLSGGYISLVDLFVRNGLRPAFCFESVRLRESDLVDEWIERVIRRLGHSIAMLYVSRSCAIDLPRMMKKGEDVRLEAADLIAFLVARDIHCRSIGRQPEIDLSALGSVHYHFWSGTEFHSRQSMGFPWTEFFGDLSL